MKPWIIGEANPYGADPDFAMYPLPENSAGGRFCSRILGMERGAYLRSFERRNLCPTKWSMPVARINAHRLWGEAGDAPMLLLGSKVCSGFGFEFKPWTIHEGDTAFVLLPHPSGLCRLWVTEPRAIERTRELVLQVAPHLVEYIGHRAAA